MDAFWLHLILICHYIVHLFCLETLGYSGKKRVMINSLKIIEETAWLKREILALGYKSCLHFFTLSLFLERERERERELQNHINE